MAKFKGESDGGDLLVSSIGELIRKQEINYISGTNTLSKYVQKSMIDDLDKIDAYINSKHTTGEVDSLGREKPFFNIVTAARNIWYRATDLDRSNIKIRSTKQRDTVAAFLATVHIQDWMRRVNFGYFLNDWGRSLATYGSTVVKFVEKEGQLIPSVVPWNRLIVDAVDFDGAPVIEIIELTEAQLRKRVVTHGYDADMVDKLCEARAVRETVGKTRKDNKNDYIKLYEVHCELPLSELTGKMKDEDIYVHQMHVVTFVATKEKGKFDDFTLVMGKEEKNPYMITHLIKEDGQTLSMGAVQHLFDAQWMVNHTVKNIKDQLDLASKLFFQTADVSFINQNAITAIETGDILTHAVNMPLEQVNNGSHDITSNTNFAAMWRAMGNEATGISDSMKGNTAPSGTPWRQIDALLQENHSLFELMTENKGLHVEDMFRIHVIPYIKKKYLNNSKEISATLEEHDINKIDGMFVPNQAIKRANKILVQKIINGEQPTPQEQQQIQDSAQGEVQSNLSSLGNQRFFAPSEISDKTWKEAFKDLEWEMEVDVTGESSTAKDDMTTLSTVFQTIADPGKAAVLQTPAGKFLFNKILSKAGGVSPLEIASIPAPSQGGPSPKFIETLSYKDAPSSVQRQMESQAGFTPATEGNAQPMLK